MRNYRTDAYREHRNKYRRAKRAIGALREKDRADCAKRRAIYPEKFRAKQLVKEAVKRGELVRPDRCLRCGATDEKAQDGRTLIQAHHHDYSKPLEIEWLCIKCHTAEHRRTR